MYQLTETGIKRTKPGMQPVKLTDGRGLYLHVAPTGGKLWRYAYRFNGKQKLMALGGYPDVSLTEARERHQKARKVLASGLDPMEERKAAKAEQDAKTTTFEDVFNLWFEKWIVGKDERHAEQTKRRVETDIIPAFGSKPVNDADADDVREMILAIDERGARDVAKRAHSTVGQIYGFAVAHKLAKRNPASDFKFKHLQLAQSKSKNFARVDAKELPALLSKMDEYKGTAITKLAMRLLVVLVLLKTSFLRVWLTLEAIGRIEDSKPYQPL